MQRVSKGVAVSGVALTIMGNDLDLGQFTEVSALLQLDTARSLEVRQGLQKLPGCEEESDSNPLILWSTGKASRHSARHSQGESMKLPDLQVEGVTVEVAGNRMILSKGGVKFFLQLEPAEARALAGKLESDFEIQA